MEIEDKGELGARWKLETGELGTSHTGGLGYTALKQN